MPDARSGAPSSFSLAIMMLVARVDPRLITKVEAAAAGRCDIQSGEEPKIHETQALLITNPIMHTNWE
jgi:hypothetical protein